VLVLLRLVWFRFIVSIPFSPGYVLRVACCRALKTKRLTHAQRGRMRVDLVVSARGRRGKRAQRYTPGDFLPTNWGGGRFSALFCIGLWQR